MKKTYQKELVLGAAIFVTTIGIMSAIGIMTAQKGNLRAQVFGSTLFFKPETHTYHVADNNFGASEGLTFKQNKVVTITACGAGGGGGGGDHGVENGSDDGAGGAGGGGGGKGTCASRSFKVRSGDTIRWFVGAGGMGGIRGKFVEAMDFGPPVDQHIIATNGNPGGSTYVSINGIDVMQLPGGNGGQAGTHASDIYLPGWGGAGGSLDPVLQQAWGHRGENGQNTGEQIIPTGATGNGGYGGNGEGQNGLLSNRGIGGTVLNPFSHGDTGGNGTTASGGGGGGGGPGRWEDYDSNGDNYVNTFRNWGGYGGIGGDGYVTISW